MARTSSDPYSDFVVRVMNSCRIALNQQGRMSQEEMETVEKVRRTLIDHDPEAPLTPTKSIIIRPTKPRGVA